MNPRSSAQSQSIALLTGGGDRPYVFGLTTALVSKGVSLDLIGSDELDYPEYHRGSQVNFLNLRGDQRPEVSVTSKVVRILAYYLRLIRYAATAKPRIFHILWNNKIEYFDRTLLTAYYKVLGKKIVLTAHNVNTKKRDSCDTRFNRLTLGFQYRSADRIFVHTEGMKRELIDEFGVMHSRVDVIPFGVNNSVPNTPLTPAKARQRLGIQPDDQVLLFFGRIAPRKGLEYLIAAFRRVLSQRPNCRLLIAGRPDRCQEYWSEVRESLRDELESGRVILRAEFIRDDETEVYFKAADALVLPYKQIYQSGVLFLGYSFGLPVLAADVGSLKDDIVEGRTGFVFKPEDPDDLAGVIDTYFASDLYKDLNDRRQDIRDYVNERHSWEAVGQITKDVYARLLRAPHDTD